MSKARRKVYRGRKDSSVYPFQARVPVDVVERLRGRKITLTLPASGLAPETAVPIILGAVVKFSLKTRDADAAAVRRAAARAELAQVYDAARRGPAPISQKNIQALCGEVYRHLIGSFQDNPGTPEEWEAWKALTRAATEGRIPGAPAIPVHGRTNDQVMAAALFGNHLTAGINALPRTFETDALEQRCAQLAYWAMRRHGLEIDDASRLTLLREVARAALEAGWQLKRMASGDYRPDPAAERFPVYAEPRAASVTFKKVVDQWVETERPRRSSADNRRVQMAAFAAFLGHDDMERVIEDDVVRWRAALLRSELAPGTITNRLKDAKATFTYAKRHKMIPANPFADVDLTVRAQRLAPRERMRGYSVEEVARLLSLARQETNPVRRWVPFLAATTGARVAELTQIWSDRIVQEDGVWLLRIRPAPDGGSLKTEASHRDVPIHPALILDGFLDFAKSETPKPLFYRPARSAKPSVHPSKPAADRLGAWIRSQGFTDPTKAPNHALRHYWKTRAHQCGVDSMTADFLQGHRGAGEASRYRHVEEDKVGLLRAVAAVPVPT